MSDNVRVAVRMRPFNSREKELKCKRCVFMKGKSTRIVNLSNEQEKNFAFDFSFDSFASGPEEDPNYATQGIVFDALGEDVLTNAWAGYNCSLFAYGQTGSGKSYSVVGYGEQKGIIPLTCEEMFRRIHANTDPNLQFRVTVSMLEIYNEKITDLLFPRAKQPKSGLSIRETPQGGVFVADLSAMAVGSYDEVERAMETGTAARTVAATQMNATSSRAHTVFLIHFRQIVTDPDTKKPTAKESKINLVDLAGSERAGKTGATGDRLKEGANINKSLSMLGLVIHTLAEASTTKKKKKIHIPYRDSKLTHILKESLGGNSKTIMIAAVSPADNNYDESMSTLRYADSAKRIKNSAKVNENPTDRLIRELREEIEKLKTTGGGGGGGGGDGVDNSALMAQNEAQLADLTQTWEEKLAESERRAAEQIAALKTAGVGGGGEVDKSTPRLVNLNEDPLMSESLVYYVHSGLTHFGSVAQEGDEESIVLKGLNISEHHCTLKNTDGKVVLVSVGESKTYLNGKQVNANEEIVLEHTNRIVLGNSHMFRFTDPIEAAKRRKEGTEQTQIIDWGMAQQELMEGTGMMKEMAEQKRKMEEEAKKREDEFAARMHEMEEQKIKMEREMAEMNSKHQQEAAEAQLKAIQQKERELEEAKIADERKAREEEKIQSELMELLPKVKELNEMASSMNVPFEAHVKLLTVIPATKNLSPIEELKHRRVESGVEVKDGRSGQTTTWCSEKFYNRYFLIQELHNNFCSYGTLPQLKPDDDPFYDPPEAFCIGRCHVYLEAVAYKLEIEDWADIVDYKGDETGKLRVEIIPVHPEGSNMDEEDEEIDFVEDPDELMGEPLSFSIRISEAQGISSKYIDVYVSYQCYEYPTDETEHIQRPKVSGSGGGICQFNFEKRYDIPRISEDHLKYFQNDAITFELMGYIELKRMSTGALATLQRNQDTTAIEEELTRSSRQASDPADGFVIDEVPDVCMSCEEDPPIHRCDECREYLCDECDRDQHKKGKRRGHVRVVIKEGWEPAKAKDPTPPPRAPTPPPRAPTPPPKAEEPSPPPQPRKVTPPRDPTPPVPTPVEPKEETKPEVKPVKAEVKEVKGGDGEGEAGKSKACLLL